MSDYYVAEGSRGSRFETSPQAHFTYARRRTSRYRGSIGGTCDAQAATVGAAYQSSVSSSHILIHGVRFHDITRRCNPTGHAQCLFVQEVVGITIEGSTFTHCDVFDIYIHRIGIPGNARHVILRHNTLARATDGGFYSLMVRADAGESIADYVIRANRLDQGAVIENEPGSTVSNVRICQNTGPGKVKAIHPTAGISRVVNYGLSTSPPSCG